MADPTTWTPIGPSTSETSADLTGLTTGTNYDFRVAASNAAGSSTSATLSATVVASNAVPPSGPSIAVQIASSSSVLLTWGASATGTPPITYQPQFTVSGQGAWANFGSAGTLLSVTITGLTAGTSYDFRVLAINAAGTTTSGSVSAVTPAQTVTPSAPTNVIVGLVTTNSAALSWSASASGTQPISYQPQYRVVGQSTWINFGASGSSTFVTITGLSPGVNYEFAVVASNAAGSVSSSTATASTGNAAVAPGPVTSFTIPAITSSSATLQWSSPTVGTPPFSYQPQYREVGQGFWSSYGVVTQAVSVVITGLSAGKTYDFQIIASNAGGSTASIIQTAATSAAPNAPSVPGKPLAWIITPTAVSFTWSASATGTAPINYVLQYRLHPNGVWFTYGSPGPGLGGSVAGLTPGEDYDFRVVASNSAGSTFSDSLTVVAPISGSNVAAPVTNFIPNQILKADDLDAQFNAKFDKIGGDVGPIAITQVGAGAAQGALVSLARSNGGSADAVMFSSSYVATFADGPSTNYGSLAMSLTVAGDASGNGPAGNMLNGFWSLQVSALRPASAGANGSSHAAVVGRVDKSPPATGVPVGRRIADATGVYAPVADHSNMPSSQSGLLAGIRSDVTANGLDDGDVRYGVRITFAEDVPLAGAGLPMEIGRGVFIGSGSTSAYAKVMVEMAGNYSVAAVDMRGLNAGQGRIISSTPTAPVTVVSVDRVLLFTSSGTPARPVTINNPKAVKINGNSYSVIAVSQTIGLESGTITFASAITAADAANGNYIVPNAHTVWLSEGSAGVSPGDVAFNRAGTARAYYDQASSAMVIETGTDKLRIAGSKSIQLPSGSNAQRSTSPAFGEIRANIESSSYEVWSPSAGAWVPLVTAAPSGGTAPGPATALVSGTPTATAVPMSWSAPTTGSQPFAYQPQYRVSGTSGWVNWGGASSALSTTVSGLTAGTRYDFQIVTSNGAGSSTSAILSVTLPAIAPSAPLSVAAGTVTGTTVPISWAAPATGTDPISYTVSSRVTGSGAGFVNAPAGSTTALALTVTGLTAGTSYDFIVTATNTAGSAQSAVTVASTSAAASAAPSAPSGVTASNPTSSSVLVSWTAPSTGTAPFSYQPQFRQTGTTPWINFGGQITTLSVTITGLSGPASYDLQIVAINSLGSATSSIISAQLPAPANAASGSVSGTQSSGTSAPVVAGPATGSVLTSNVLPITGITITDAGAAIAQGTCTLAINCTSGKVSATVGGSQVAGSGSASINYVNTLAACQQAAANLVYTAPTAAAADTLTVKFTDQSGANAQITISVSVTTTTQTGGNTTYRSPTLQPFTSTSFWNRGLGSNATWSSPSDADTIALLAGQPVINAGQFSVPFYVGKATDPLITITAQDQTFPIPPQQVRIPASATPSAGANGSTATADSDAHMTLYDETQPQYVWNYFKCVRNSNGTMSAYSGVVDNVCGDGLTPSGVSRRYAFGLGCIRTAEIQAGAIKHMIRFSLPTARTKSPGSSWDVNIPWPNDVEDYSGPTDYTGQVVFGSTVGIPASVNLNSLGITTASGMALAVCFQKYGGLMRDTGGGSNQGVILYAEQSAEGMQQLSDMRNDFAKIIPALRIMRNQTATNVNGGGTYPPAVDQLDVAVCPVGGGATNIPTDTSGTIASPAQKVLNGFGVNTHIDHSNYQSLGLGTVENCINYLGGIKLLRDAASSTSDSTWWAQVAQTTNTRFIAYIGMANQSGFAAFLNNAKAVPNAYLAALEGCQEADTGAISGFTETLAQAATFQQTVWAAGQQLGLPVIQMSFGQGYDVNTNGNYGAVGNQSAYATYGNSHDYSPGSPQQDGSIAEAIRLAQIPTPGKPVAITQWGWNMVVAAGYANVSPATAAAYTLNMIFGAYQKGCPYYIFESLIDDNQVGAATAGLFTAAGSPKPAATAVKNLFTLLSDTGSNATIFSPGRLNYTLTNMPANTGTTGGYQVLTQKSDGSFWLALWNEQGLNNKSTGADTAVSPVNVGLSLGSTAASITVYDPVNSLTPVQSVTSASSITVSVPARVILVKIVK